jgi:hypothetical protein
MYHLAHQFVSLSPSVTEVKLFTSGLSQHINKKQNGNMVDCEQEEDSQKLKQPTKTNELQPQHVTIFGWKVLNGMAP